MKRSLLVNLMDVAPRFFRRPSRKSLAQSASLLVLAGMAMAAAPHRAEASTSYKIAFDRLYCVDESGEIGSDEPYVVFFAANMSGTGSATNRTMVFGDVDTGEYRFDTVNLWNGIINSPDQPLVLAAAIEHDDSSATHVRNTVSAILTGNLAAYKAQGKSRAQIAALLKTDMSTAINLAINVSGNDDDRVGGIKEVVLTAGNLLDAKNGLTVNKLIDCSGDGTHYQLRFRLTKS